MFAPFLLCLDSPIQESLWGHCMQPGGQAPRSFTATLYLLLQPHLFLGAQSSGHSKLPGLPSMEYAFVYPLEQVHMFVFLGENPRVTSFENIFCFLHIIHLPPHPVSSCKTPIIALAIRNHKFLKQNKPVPPTSWRPSWSLCFDWLIGCVMQHEGT